jgi:hypothetical protein
MAYIELDPNLYSAFLDEDLNYGYCVRNDNPEHAKHAWTGKKLLAADLPDPTAGWLFLLEAGALLDGYTDRLNPIWLSTPTVLYRSMSLHELADIANSGIIKGNGHTWNDFEPRHLVFFSPEPTLQCLYQGTELDRLASVLTMQELTAELAPGCEITRTAFLTRYKEHLAELEAVIPDMTYTAAAIETRPLTKGFHYSREHGSTGMNGEDEFGFIPGFLKLADVTKVHWMKGTEIVATSDVNSIMDTLQEIGFADHFLADRVRSGPSI